MTRFLLFALLATIICFIAKTHLVEGQLTYNWKKFNRPSRDRRPPKKPGRSVFNVSIVPSSMSHQFLETLPGHQCFFFSSPKNGNTIVLLPAETKSETLGVGLYKDLHDCDRQPDYQDRTIEFRISIKLCHLLKWDCSGNSFH